MDPTTIVFGAPLGFEYVYAAALSIVIEGAIPFVLVWQVGPALLGRRTLSAPARLGLAAAIPALALTLLALNFLALPVGYAVSSSAIEIRFRGRVNTIRLADVTGIARDTTGGYRSVYSPAYTQFYRWSGRRMPYIVVPVGFQNVGLAFQELHREVNLFEAYVTDPQRVVAVHSYKLTTVSPEEPERFVTEVTKRLVAPK